MQLFILYNRLARRSLIRYVPYPKFTPYLLLADIKKLAPAPAQILYRLRLQPKNLGSDRFRLRNTEYNIWRKEKKKRKKYDVYCVVGWFFIFLIGQKTPFNQRSGMILDVQIQNFGRFWRLTTFLCFFKNTEQNNICASILFQLKQKKNMTKIFF